MRKRKDVKLGEARGRSDRPEEGKKGKGKTEVKEFEQKEDGET